MKSKAACAGGGPPPRIGRLVPMVTSPARLSCRSLGHLNLYHRLLDTEQAKLIRNAQDAFSFVNGRSRPIVWWLTLKSRVMDVRASPSLWRLMASRF